MPDATAPSVSPPARAVALAWVLALAAALVATGVPWRVAAPHDDAPARPVVGLPGAGDLTWRATPAPTGAPVGAAAGLLAALPARPALRAARRPRLARRGRTGVRAGRAQRWFARRLLDGG